AETKDQKSAVDEGVRRQAARKELRDTLEKARLTWDRRELANAAKLYDAAWDLVVRIGSGVEGEAEVTKAGLAGVRLELARAAQARGDLHDAATHVKDVLRVDPANMMAMKFQRENDRLIM